MNLTDKSRATKAIANCVINAYLQRHKHAIKRPSDGTSRLFN